MPSAGIDQFYFPNRPDGLFFDLAEVRKILKYFVRRSRMVYFVLNTIIKLLYVNLNID